MQILKVAKWLDDRTLEREDVSLSLAQDRLFSFVFRTENYFFYFIVCLCQKLLHLIFQKMQYCVTVSSSYSWVGSQEPLIIIK